MPKLSAWLAIAVGAPLFVGQIARNLDNLEYWPTWGVDLLVAALLVAAGVGALRGAAPKYLASAWSFSAAMYLSSFVSRSFHAATIGTPAEDRLTAIIGGLCLVSVVGAGMVLLGRRTVRPRLS